MTDEQMVYEIFQYVREHGEIIPREHKTIGSFWTVDRWHYKGLAYLEVQLQDEGYTHVVIIKDMLHASSTHGRPVHYTIGDKKRLAELYRVVIGG